MPHKRAEQSVNSGATRKRIKHRDLDSKESSQQDIRLQVAKPKGASCYSSRGVQNQNGLSQDLESISCRGSGDSIESADHITDVVCSSSGKEIKMHITTPGQNALSLLGAAACIDLRQNEKLRLQESNPTVFSVSSESAPEKVNYEPVSTQASSVNGEQCFTSPHLISVDLTLRPANIYHDDTADNIDKPNVSCQKEVSVRNKDQQGCGGMWKNAKRKNIFDTDGKVSECGSSAGPLDEAGSLQIWKAMKKSGFLSSQFHATLHKRLNVSKPPLAKKVKANLLKRNVELAKREHVNRFTKIAAPSGLLTGLNPGIINHVRNSKQVQSIIEALVKSEKLDNPQNQQNSVGQIRAGTKATTEKEKDPQRTLVLDGDSSNVSGSSAASHGFEDPRFNFFLKCESNDNCDIYSSSLSEHRNFELEKLEKIYHVDAFVNAQLKYEDARNALPMMLPPMPTSLETFSRESTEDISINQAALVSHQWLGLLSQDIKGRLAALKRSKKRVQMSVRYELPMIMAKEFSPDQENEQHNGRTSWADSANNGLPDDHIGKWRSLFDKMERALQDEAKQLESWLKQVKEMQLCCERGLHEISKKDDGNMSEHTSRSTKDDMEDGEYAVRAAAASIYSTCNFALSAENISCF